MYTMCSQADLFCGHMLVIVPSQLYTYIYGCGEHKFEVNIGTFKNNTMHGTRSLQERNFENGIART
jgi:hypothetical protein